MEFEGAIIGDKKFPFVQETINESAKIIKKLKPSFRRSIKLAISPVFEKKRWWKKVRSIAFIKTGLWRFGIVPKELRCSVITPQKAEEIENDFFAYAAETVKEYERLYPFATSSLTAIKESKSVD